MVLPLSDPVEGRGMSLLKDLMVMYSAAMTPADHDEDIVTELIPHLVGPPGCGKSTFARQLADLVGRRLHIINVSRLSPLEVEGVQMPVGDVDDMRLHMLTATFWTRIEDGDVVMFDEFLRGFPEVFNAILDVITGRRVGDFEVPHAFFMAASNSVTTYDGALEDRLLHLRVPDARKSQGERSRIARLLCEQTGMLPTTADTPEMKHLIKQSVLPTYDLLDTFNGSGSKVAGLHFKGESLRKLIGQIRLRNVQNPDLAEVVRMNNATAMSRGLPQFVVLLKGTEGELPVGYRSEALRLRGSRNLTAIQKINLDLNLQLIEMEDVVMEGDDE